MIAAFVDRRYHLDMPFDTDPIRQARVDLAAVHRIAVLEGWHEGTWNHFSAKVPGHPGHTLITPGHTHFSRVTASGILIVGPDGSVVDGQGTPNLSAWSIHDAVQRARPDVGCALHLHPPYGTALASIENWRMDCRAGQDAAKFYGRVGYYGYRGVVTESNEGAAIAHSLAAHRVLVMENHGILVVGKTIEEAALYFLVFERACRTEWLVMSAGGAMRSIPTVVAEAEAAREDAFGELGYLRAMQDVLDRAGADYAE